MKQRSVAMSAWFCSSVDTLGNEGRAACCKGPRSMGRRGRGIRPRRRAFRRASSACDDEARVAVDSSHTMLGAPGRKNVRTFWSCVLTSRAPGMTTNASARAAKIGGFSASQPCPFRDSWAAAATLGKPTTETSKTCSPGRSCTIAL